MISSSSDYKATCLDYIPTAYGDIQEFRALAKAYNIEVERLMAYMISIHNNRFLDTLDEYGCDRWEKILNLKSLNADGLEDRRFAIRAKLFGQRPYTLRKLRELLGMLVGAGNYVLALDTNRNHLKCMIALSTKNQLKAVRDLLEQTVPVNISLEVDLMYNTHAELENYTHADMESYTHTDLREEEL